MMQTILGSGGAIGLPLARELTKYTDRIRLISRNPVKVNETDELFPMDVNDFDQIDKGIAGSDVVYVTIGFNYNIKVWEKTWPPFMQSVLEACRKHQTRLVFFDNIYLYDKSSVSFMTETAPINPPSKKGRVRAQLHHMIMESIEKNNVKALIARSADFYGPENKNSALKIMVMDNLMKDKKAQIFGDISKIHTYTYTPDAAKATAILGNTEDAYNQVWHLPTTKERLTSGDWIRLIARELNKEASVQTIPNWMLHVLGVFIPIMKEFPEMIYQYSGDYIFDSSKFENRFGIKPTLPEVGIKEMISSI